jgi:multisubunit Na+/H+ antiporter MnhE subunit
MPDNNDTDPSQQPAEQPQKLSIGVRLRVLGVGFVLAGAVYLLLIDTTSLPELYAGAGVTLIGAFALVAAREQDAAGAHVSPRWLARALRLLVAVPRDVALVAAMAPRQLLRPRPRRGALRSTPFAHGGDEPSDVGRRALAEALGSLAPNTIVVGIDERRERLLVHQLWLRGDASELDALGLG